MKLSLAVALLGQTVPTLSKRYHPAVQREGALSFKTAEDISKAKSSPQSIFDHDDERRGLRYSRRVTRNLAKTMKNTPSLLKTLVPCDPKSIDADVGILSCGEDHVCQPSSISSLGGLCTPLESSHQAHNHGHHSILPGKESQSQPLSNNLHPQGTDLEECDPTLVDVGILVCGEGRYCQHDEMSGLGGFCLDSLNHNHRRLQYYDLDYYLYYCGPYPVDAPYQYCDCSGVNTAKGTGTIACTMDGAAQEVQGCDEYDVYISFSYSFENSALVKMDTCYETKSPLAEKVCFTYDLTNPASDCYTDWNGQRCGSCATSAYSTSFDCSNVGGRVGDYWVETLSVFDTCRSSSCTNVCGAGLYIPEAKMATSVTIGGYPVTCGVLSLFEEHKLIFDVDCPSYSQAALTSCCAPAVAAATTSAPTVATVSAPADPVPATPATVPATPATVPASPAPVVPATPAPVPAPTPAPVPLLDDSVEGVSKEAKKEKDNGDAGEPKQAKKDGRRQRA